MPNKHSTKNIYQIRCLNKASKCQYQLQDWNCFNFGTDPRICSQTTISGTCPREEAQNRSTVDQVCQRYWIEHNRNCWKGPRCISRGITIGGPEPAWRASKRTGARNQFWFSSWIGGREHFFWEIDDFITLENQITDQRRRFTDQRCNLR